MNFIEEIKKYMVHLPNCSTRQNWSEAVEATSLLPESIEKHNYEQQLRHQMQTCTCGHDAVVVRLKERVLA